MATHNLFFSSAFVLNGQNTKRFPCHAISKTPPSQSKDVAVARRSANYRPPLWDHQYLLSVENIYDKETEAVENAKVLKEEVRKKLVETETSLEQLEMINSLQRLGISYHYKPEIHDILKNIHHHHYDIGRESRDLHLTALEFLLLRQHGFHVSQDFHQSYSLHWTCCHKWIREVGRIS